VIDRYRRQVLGLLLGEVEPDADDHLGVPPDGGPASAAARAAATMSASAAAASAA